jgi:hypothetical protein
MLRFISSYGLSRGYSNLLAKLNAGQSYAFPTLPGTVLRIDSINNGAAQIRVETNNKVCGTYVSTNLPAPTTLSPTPATSPLRDVGNNGSSAIRV